MGYDIGWAIVGTEPLGRDELEDLHAHVARWAKRIVGYDLSVATSPQPRMQAYFSLRPERADDAEVDEEYYGNGVGGYALDVVDTIFEAMEKLRDIVPRHEVLVQDDFHGFEWDGKGFGIAEVDIEWPAWKAEGWLAIGALALGDLKERFADRPTGLRPPREMKKRASPERQDQWLAGPLDWTSEGEEVFVGPWRWWDREPEKPFFQRLDEVQAAAIADREATAAEPPTDLASMFDPGPVSQPASSEAEIDRLRRLYVDGPPAEAIKMIDELIQIVINEVTNISQEDRNRYGLQLQRSPSRMDVREEVARCLAKRWPEQAAHRLLERANEWMSMFGIMDVAHAVFGATTQSPEIIERAIDLWKRAIVDRDRARNVDDYLRPFAPSLFAAAREILRSPIPSLDRDTGIGVLRTLAYAGRSVPDAVSVLVACIRRDRREPRWTRWREDALDALERMENLRGVPTALIEVSGGDVRMRTPLRIIARDPERGFAMLARMRDCAELAENSIDLLDANPDRHASEAAAFELLCHPFWRVRVWALGRMLYSAREGAALAVWATLAGADAAVPDSDRERFLGNIVTLDRAGYLAEARKRGFAGELAALPTAVEGLASRCSDHRTWALAFVDKRGRAADAAALVLADELDLALSRRGHLRTVICWPRWRDAIAELPGDAAGRSGWAREHAGEVPAELLDVAERGAEAVAADYPFGRFALAPEELELFERLEQDIASRGEELLAR